MRKLLCLSILIVVAVSGCISSFTNSEFQSSWQVMPNRRWAGPDFWANRLQDWQVANGRLECVERTGKMPMRTVHLLTRSLGSHPGNFQMSADCGPVSGSTGGDGAAGFLIGAGDSLDYRAAALIHHSSGPKAGLFCGVDEEGRLFIRDFESDNYALVEHAEGFGMYSAINLRLEINPKGDGYELCISAYDLQSDSLLDQLTVEGINKKRTSGSIALVSHPGSGEGGGRFWFQKWHVAGTKIKIDENRNCGPILSTQYTLSRKVLKLTAQMMPLGSSGLNKATLYIKGNKKWESIAEAIVDQTAWTATFKVENWDDTINIPYKVVYNLEGTNGSNREYSWGGTVRKDPADKEEIVVAAFTGNHNVQRPRGKWAGVDGGTFDWSVGVFFPHADLTGHVEIHQPDVLFYSGDQVYEGASPTRADRGQLFEDYLYKWYLWCWAYRDLTKDIPTVTIPDDHDVYHGNIWGAGGPATPKGTSGAKAQDAGGYKHSAEFVKMVERTQTSHLPDPYDPTPIQQGIGVYYCDMLYGGVSFAVLEDRKFKSAPRGFLPKAEVVNGWAQNTAFDAAKDGDAPGAKLLGNRQLDFLKAWSADWSNNAWMKVVLSQTIFANVATLPSEAVSDAVVPRLPILETGDYPEDDIPVQDMDSNGWPQTGRNKAVKLMRKGFAIHIAGDQHLGSTIQYGVDEWHDGGFALCVPSVANFWPRRWFPKQGGASREEGAPKYTGDFKDGFGNLMTVHAISNPYQSGRKPSTLYDLATGYGIVRLNRETRKISMTNWPRWADPAAGDKPYPGWPVLFDQEDNYGSRGDFYLPVIEVVGMKDPVIQVIQEQNEEIIYTLRIKGTSWQPRVLEKGLYTITVGNPDGDLKTVTHLEAGVDLKSKTVSVDFK